MKLCRDKTTKSALEALKMRFYSYGFSSTVRSDGGPRFKETFSHKLDKLGVKHVLSSAHNPQSNGGAERVCKSIREVLDKRGGHRTDFFDIFQGLSIVTYIYKLHKIFECFDQNKR